MESSVNPTTALAGSHTYLVLVRHGVATSNEAQAFGGWDDVPLAPRGIEQARRVGLLLRKSRLNFDVSLASVLRRAIWTQWYCLDAMDRLWMPTVADWRLNERHYGGLQGLKKADAVRFWGAQQVQQWRRGFRQRPPLLDPDDERDSFGRPAYQGLSRTQVPLGESLQDTQVRVQACWDQAILPRLAAGDNVMVFAHGNSIRALQMKLDGISEDAIAAVEVPNGQPLVYAVTDHARQFTRIDLPLVQQGQEHQIQSLSFTNDLTVSDYQS